MSSNSYDIGRWLDAGLLQITAPFKYIKDISSFFCAVDDPSCADAVADVYNLNLILFAECIPEIL